MLRIHDTLTGQVTEPPDTRGLRVYVCAPPADRPPHLGDLRAALLPDLVRRVTERHRMRMVVCLGVDDAGVAERHDLAADALALNLRTPERTVRVSEHADQALGLIARLIKQDDAAVAPDGRVVLSSPEVSPYAGEPEGEADPQPDGPAADPVLWRPVDGDPAWDSPWGRGLPGPHVACAALALRWLGDRIDLWFGGAEPFEEHRETVRAQMDAVAGHPVVRVWAHGAGLRSEPRTLAEVTDAGLDPLAVRLAFLEHHYRSPLSLTWDALRAADATLRRWRARVAEWSESPSAPMAAEHVRRAMAALDDDLGTPAALRVLHELEADDSVPAGAKFESFLHLDHVLALDLPAEIGKLR